MSDSGRTYEIRREDGIWMSIEFKDIKKGDVFRGHEEDGTKITCEPWYADGIYTATEDAKLTDGVWGVTFEDKTKGDEE